MWESTSGYLGEQLSLKRFKEWTFNDPSTGKTNTISPSGKYKIQTTYNGINPPLVTFTAQWIDAYDKITFYVEDKPYCDVLIDRNINKLVYPANPPKLTSGQKYFDGWNIAEGSILSGIDASKTIICGSSDKPVVCIAPNDKEDPIVCVAEGDIICDETAPILCLSEGGSDEDYYNHQIICQDDEGTEYGLHVDALVAEKVVQRLDVTFFWNERTEAGTLERKTMTLDVPEGTRLPKFHIVNQVVDGDYTYVFRYWLLESGNMSSNMNVLSSCNLVAVYDKTKTEDFGSNEQDDEGKGSAKTPESQAPVDSLDACPHLLEGQDGDWHCSLCGLDPKSTNAYQGCPYISFLTHIYSPPAGQDRILKPYGIVRITHVVHLMKALFKVNLDIAHKEFFYKNDAPEVTDWWYGYTVGTKWFSFEPTVEVKFSNFHAANQPLNGRLICTEDPEAASDFMVHPVNKELEDDDGAIQYSDIHYFYDYWTSLKRPAVWSATAANNTNVNDISPNLDDDMQRLYQVLPLCLYENSTLQSPVDINDFIRRRIDVVSRSSTQVQTFTSILKKYRPVKMPKVRDIYNSCQGQDKKVLCDEKNDYGVFGWCTIPSKTMVDMEYNEGALYVPSTYDHHNRVGGSNFLQLDADLEGVYESTWGYFGHLKDSWYYAYNTRDWTYFMKPFFNRGRNNDVFSQKVDEGKAHSGIVPPNSNHLNGVIYEQVYTLEQNSSGTWYMANNDPVFGDMVDACQFLARYHHGANNLKRLSEMNDILSYENLRRLTMVDGKCNMAYGSKFEGDLSNMRFPLQDWVDDYDKTSSNLEKK